MTKIIKPIYLGIENEFQLMEGKKYTNFSVFFKKFEEEYNKKHFSWGTAMRTVSGTSIYSDGNEPEVCIPPVKIEKGAATNASDLLYLARKELVDFMKPFKEKEKINMNLIGYTSHFSITNVFDVDNTYDMMQYFAVPYSLFCLNPTSTGIGLRPKNGRLELLGDFVPNIDQNRAFLNFYMGTMPLLRDNMDKLPFYAIKARNISENLVCDGRYSKIEIKNKMGARKEIYAQDYLEKYYGLFKESIKEFATESEMKNLEDFIYMKKPLEIDKFKKWAHGSIFKIGKRLNYDEDLTVKDSDYLEEKNLPDLTSKFLSRIVSTDSISMTSIDWNKISFRDARGDMIFLDGIHNQERLERLIQNYEKNPKGIPKIIQKYSRIMDILRANNIDFIPEYENGLREFAKNLLEGKCLSEKYHELAAEGLFRNRKPTDFGRNFANAILSTKCIEYNISENPRCFRKFVKTGKRTLEYDSSKDDSLPDFEEKMKDAFLSENTRDYVYDRIRNSERKLDDLKYKLANEGRWPRFLGKLVGRGMVLYSLAFLAGLGFSLGKYLSFRPEKEKTECAAPIAADSAKISAMDSMKTSADSAYIWKEGGIKE
ncbi:MAG: hypothetical protein WC475_01290 [Candidatus Paceibacterota bacterium]